MKQAIEEGFILDVLKNYTPVESYYRLMKTLGDDPRFDAKRAQKKLRRYVEPHDYAIHKKAEIVVDHFHDQVMAHCKIGGAALPAPAVSFVLRGIGAVPVLRGRIGAEIDEAGREHRIKLFQLHRCGVAQQVEVALRPVEFPGAIVLQETVVHTFQIREFLAFRSAGIP